MAEVKGVRLAAERDLDEACPDGAMTPEAIRQLVLGLEDLPKVLTDADPAGKAEVYSGMGIKITYEPGSSIVVVEARPRVLPSVGGALVPLSTPATLRVEWAA
jgi:hypothetical protein